MKRRDDIMDGSSIAYIFIVKIPYTPAGMAFRPLQIIYSFENQRSPMSSMLQNEKPCQHSLNYETISCCRLG